MKTRVITLPEAFDRQKKIDALFNSKNIDFQYKIGVGPKDIKITSNFGFICKNKTYSINKDNLIKYTNRVWIRFGEIAALMAHKSIWEELIKDENENVYLICEDDCRFSDSFTMEYLDQFDDTKYDLLYLQAVTAHYQNKNNLLQLYLYLWLQLPD